MPLKRYRRAMTIASALVLLTRIRMKNIRSTIETMGAATAAGMRSPLPLLHSSAMKARPNAMADRAAREGPVATQK